MTEREALLHAICLEPGEDTPRLAYADWLDEYGDEADKTAAEQIRAQIENPAEHIELHWKHPTLTGITGSVSRGYVAEIELSVHLYLMHGAELFRQHPITVAHFSDKSPFCESGNDMFRWVCTAVSPIQGAEHVLPSTFREPMLRHPLCLNRYPLCFGTRVEARLAASEIAVNLARQLLDFPPLPLTKRLRPNDEPA